MGLQSLSKEIHLKNPTAEIRITRPLSPHLPHCTCYNVPKDASLALPATWPTLSRPILGRVCGPLLTTPPMGSLHTPQPTSKGIGRPNSSSINQQVSRCMVRLLSPGPPLSLGRNNKHNHTPRVSSARLPGRPPSGLSVSCLNKLVFSVPYFEWGKFFFHPRAETTTHTHTPFLSLFW